jgi:hypothetical protein
VYSHESDLKHEQVFGVTYACNVYYVMYFMSLLKNVSVLLCVLSCRFSCVALCELESTHTCANVCDLLCMHIVYAVCRCVAVHICRSVDVCRHV